MSPKSFATSLTHAVAQSFSPGAPVEGGEIDARAIVLAVGQYPFLVLNIHCNF